MEERQTSILEPALEVSECRRFEPCMTHALIYFLVFAYESDVRVENNGKEGNVMCVSLVVEDVDVTMHGY